MSDSQFQIYQAFNMHPIDVATVDKFSPRAEYVELKQPAKSAAASIQYLKRTDDRMKRIMREIKAVVTDLHLNIDVYVNDRDMSFLKIILEVSTCLLAIDNICGTFLLTCDIPMGYSRCPPEIPFVTFILHPNVSKQAKFSIEEPGCISTDASVSHC
ncbi:hypothetical protein C8J57DRAFT_1295463 [Mycena rebaudengoi]|nr:hypothetical protein C8J57DRAFT_1295463 [Mycena rebaudengoi]